MSKFEAHTIRHINGLEYMTHDTAEEGPRGWVEEGWGTTYYSAPEDAPLGRDQDTTTCRLIITTERPLPESVVIGHSRSGGEINAHLDREAASYLNEQGLIVATADGEPCGCWINVYVVNRNYGGPEEGGWYWDSHELIQSLDVSGGTIEAALEVARVLARGQYSNTDRRGLSSVLSTGIYEIVVAPCRGRSWPSTRPHWE